MRSLKSYEIKALKQGDPIVCIDCEVIMTLNVTGLCNVCTLLKKKGVKFD